MIAARMAEVKRIFRLVLMKILFFLLILLVIFIAVMHLFPQINFRTMPDGLCEARLDDKPNWVSSLVDTSDSHYIKPLEPRDPEQLAQCLSEKIKNLTVTHIDESHFDCLPSNTGI